MKNFEEKIWVGNVNNVLVTKYGDEYSLMHM